ncbi:MAG TPA: exodeoxyribonuclease III [Candidatus Saccharimonadia bacterium]|nr:exodeoxyribonuclease III [Candidatus Saccharimonadia bacterium]
MRIITANVNGIRSAASKGFFDWMARQRADIVCLQETKCHRAQLDRSHFPRGWHAHYNCAESKGYSGVAIYAKREPDSVLEHLGWDEFDREGRYIEARYGDLSVVSLYLPSGSSGETRQAFKYRVLDWLAPHLEAWRTSGRHYVLCGDWNIAHRNVDLKNWRSNQKNSGFLPEERAWLDRVFAPDAWLDAYRALKPDAIEYTWWSNRGRARENNVGWRIDYHVVTPTLRDALRAVSIYRKRWFSDHAPLTVEYDL